jgi:nicotinate-nucleotide adenylyltransferase
MVYHAIKDKPGMFVCPMEARAPGSSYTVETLERIRSEVAENVAELFFIVGADCLDQLCQWRDVSKLPMLAQIVPVARPGARDLGSDSTLVEELAQALGEEAVAALRTNRVAGVSLPISSTQIRMQLATQEASGVPLPDTVIRYIEDRGLYRS